MRRRRGRYARPGSRRRDDGQARRDDLGSSSNQADEPTGAVAGGIEYHAYSTAFDRVVTAAALATREELAQLRRKLEADMTAPDPFRPEALVHNRVSFGHPGASSSSCSPSKPFAHLRA